MKANSDELKLLFSLIDLTSLSHSDTEQVIKNLCFKSFNEEHAIKVAGICVYPVYIPLVKNILSERIKIVSVVGGFPDSQTPTKVKIAEAEYAIKSGADEIDIVLPTGKWLDSKKEEISTQFLLIKNICEQTNTKLKVILETGYFAEQKEIEALSKFAIQNGADFLKTSTGKNGQGATLEAVETMSQVIKDYYIKTGKKIGIKPSGGIRTVKDAYQYINIVRTGLGEEWLRPELFRIGASSLADEIIKELDKL